MPACACKADKKERMSFDMTEIFNINTNTAAQPRILAHRGTTVFAPENTLASFRYAGERGVWAIETDLRYTRDGVIVCIHNATVDARFEGSGAVADMTFAELRQLTARHEKFCDTYPVSMLRVPTLDEYLAICLRYGAVPFIEIKDDVVSETVEKLRALDLEKRAVISSSKIAHLYAARSLSDDIFIHHIFTSMSEAAEMAALGNAGVAFNYPNLDEVPDGLVDQIHGMGLRLCFRAGDTPEAVQRMLSMGLDYIPSNRMYGAE